MTRQEIMNAIRRETGTRYFIRKFNDVSCEDRHARMEFAINGIADELKRDIEKARFCYRNRYGLETV